MNKLRISKVAGCAILGALFLAMIAGCGNPGPKLLRVTGTVKHKGEPLPGAVVTFVFDSGETASGNTDSSGKFAIDTVPGQAKVGVTKLSASGSQLSQADLSNMTPTEAMAKMQGGGKTKEEMEAKQKDELPSKYGNPNTSGFVADVKEGGTNDFTFDLTE